MDAKTLLAIVESDTNDLRALAKIARGEPSSFYRGANFDDADLRGEDLRGFNLEGSTFQRTRFDRTTKLDGRFLHGLGLDTMVTLRIPRPSVPPPASPQPRRSSRTSTVTNILLEHVPQLYAEVLEQFVDELDLAATTENPNLPAIAALVSYLLERRQFVLKSRPYMTLMISARTNSKLEALADALDRLDFFTMTAVLTRSDNLIPAGSGSELAGIGKKRLCQVFLTDIVSKHRSRDTRTVGSGPVTDLREWYPFTPR